MEKDRLDRGFALRWVSPAFAPSPVPLSPARALPSHLLVAVPPGTMAAAHAAQTLIDFDTLAAEAGAGEVVLNYLRARGLARTATLALVEPTEARFRATVIDPLVAGYVDAATNAEFRVAAGDQPSITAILLHMYLEARSQWDAGRPPGPQLFAPRPRRRPHRHRPRADDAQPAVAAGGPAAQVLRRLGPPGAGLQRQAPRRQASAVPHPWPGGRRCGAFTHLP